MAKPIIDVNLNDLSQTTLLLDSHIKFLVKVAKSDDCTLDFLKMSGIYWSLTAMDLMNALDELPGEEIVEFVLNCHQSDGGFSPAIDHDSHVLSTLSAIQILSILNKIDLVDQETVCNYVLSLKVCIFLFISA